MKTQRILGKVHSFPKTKCTRLMIEAFWNKHTHVYHMSSLTQGEREEKQCKLQGKNKFAYFFNLLQ